MNQTIKLALTTHGDVKSYSIRRFEELMGIRYLPHLECENWKIEQWIRKKCTQADAKDKVGDLARWLGKLHAKALAESTIPDVTVRWVDDAMGYGVFANRSFAAWEFVGEYAGVVRQRSRLVPSINDYCFVYPHEWFPWKALTIDSEKEGNFTRFINHSDYPNLESVSVYFEGMFRIIFRAIKPISPGAELSYDYGNIYWRARNKRDETTN